MSYLQKTWPLVFSIITHVLIIGWVMSAYTPPKLLYSQSQSITVRLDDLGPRKILHAVTSSVNKTTTVSSAPKAAPIVKSTSQMTEPVNTQIVEAQSAKTMEEFTPLSLNADYLHTPAPEYPPLARRRGEQGRVLLSVTISTTGEAAVVTISQSSGYALLDQSALQAVKTWRFVPARFNNHAVVAEVIVPVRFTLES
jgi:protein TonB